MSHTRHMTEDRFTKLFKYMEERFAGVDERFKIMDDFADTSASKTPRIKMGTVASRLLPRPKSLPVEHDGEHSQHPRPFAEEPSAAEGSLAWRGWPLRVSGPVQREEATHAAFGPVLALDQRRRPRP
jgi:hypothetical protein